MSTPDTPQEQLNEFLQAVEKGSTVYAHPKTAALLHD